MRRSDIRYKLFTLQTEAERGVEVPPLPEGFRESFETQEHFRGFINFGVTWDVDDDDPWKVVPLEMSHLERWHETLRNIVPVITPEGDIVSAEEWEQRSHSTN